jgi:hypothetical protein
MNNPRIKIVRTASRWIAPNVTPALCTHTLSYFAVQNDCLLCESCGVQTRLPSCWFYVGKLVG